jgi:predicted Zn-dependent protease
MGAIAPPAFSQVAVPAAPEIPLPLSLQAHPLPPTLAQWQDPENLGDYFAAIQPTDVGYLIWSKFPVKVYIEPVPETQAAGFERDRAQDWVTAVTQAIQDWNIYLPLEIVADWETADIQVLRRAPPLRFANAPSAPAPLPRARSAETWYQLFVDRSKSLSENTPGGSSGNASAVLSQRFTVYLSANQTAAYTEATARHELGHAMGIWGHSPLQTDVLYFAQVRNPPAISHRDVNTLKRIYQQPTRLGWTVAAGI